MKQHVIYIVLLLLTVSCASEERKMQKIIKDYLYITLDDYKSYEPISFSQADSCFSDWTMDPLLPEIEANNMRMSHLADSLQKELDYKASLGYSINEAMKDFNLFAVATLYTTVEYKAKKDSIQNHFVSDFIGYGINHIFRSNNRLGATVRHNLQFIIDPTITNVIMVRDIDAGEEITNHHKVLNKYEKEELALQAMLAKYPDIKERNQAFLDENRHKEGVIETTSGLQYRVISEGKGKHPTADSDVSFNYNWRTIDGDVQESSKDGHITVAPKRLLDGLKEGILMMKPGAKYEFVLPYNLAYGEKGVDNVPPYSTLIYEVELISIK